VLCPSCSAASLDAYGRCHHCGWSAAPPAQPYAAYYPQPRLISPTAPAGVGLAAQILIAVSGLLAVIAFGVNVWAFGVARTAYDAPGSNGDAVNAAAGLAGIFIVLSLLLGLATGIVFIVWFFKSANLAAILAPGRQALSPGWAIGGWFIPLGWLVLPRVVAGGIWRAAIPLTSHPTGRRPRTYLVTWWWLSFCVGEMLLLSPVSAIRGDAASSWAAVEGSFTASWVADSCRVVSAVLGILMIRKVTQMQQIRILQGPGIGHPYAAPAVAHAPYAAYAEPTPAPFAAAPIPTAPLGGPADAYGPTTGTPYALSQPAAMAASPSQPQPQPQPQPGPAVEALPATLVEPSEAVTEARPAAAERVEEPATEPRAAVPSDAVPSDAVPADAVAADAAPSDAAPADAAPADAVPADVPTAVIPRQQTQDRATVVLAAVAEGPGESQDAGDATPDAKALPAPRPEPQDSVPTEPRDI
jgi:hypothetical protein